MIGDRRETILAHALSLSALHGLGPWPKGGDPLPDETPDKPLLSSTVLDGIQTHHFRTPSSPEPVEEIAGRIAALASDVLADPDPDLEALAPLHDRLAGQRALSIADDLVRHLRNGDLPGEGLRRVGRALCEHGLRREAVKAGIVILGVAADKRDRELLLLLGALEEFTLFAVVALANSQPDRDRAVYELARRVDGWGRIHAVERLKDCEDPEIKAWLLRDGFRNGVMNEYLACLAAVTGDLYGALLEPEVDDELLDGAGDIISALLLGGPAEDIRDYPDALPVLHRYLELIQDAAPTLTRLGAVLDIARILRKPYKGLDWPDGAQKAVVTRAATVLERPIWREIVTERLADPQGEFGFNIALSCATGLGMAVWPQIADHLERNPFNSYVWQTAMEDKTATEAIALAERLLPLDRLATGPDTCLGLGFEFEAEMALDTVVWRLAGFPGRGLPLIEVALANRVLRVRWGAIKALAAWPAVPSEPVEWVRTAARREPDEELRAKMEAFLH